MVIPGIMACLTIKFESLKLLYLDLQCKVISIIGCDNGQVQFSNTINLLYLLLRSERA